MTNDWEKTWGTIHWNTAETAILERTKQLIADKADVNMQDERGFTPLMWASYYGHAKVVRELIGAKADLDKQDEVGGTALILAVSGGLKNKEVVRILIDAGVNLDLQDHDGWTALKISLAARYGELSRMLNEAERRQRAAKVPTPVKIGEYSLMSKILDPKVEVSTKEHE
ncbi:MAG: ankyrin repeat domain-containing protein [Alphaproteobacteria bacterium]|nr:ankyrin repeat domain-containing protein [Alphaproteobacteria bacterium]